MEPAKTESEHKAAALDALVDAALMHVMFDGWGSATFKAAVADSGVNRELARQAAPRGAVDLAVALHRRGDARMCAALAAADMSALRYSEKVAFAVRKRLVLAAPHREAVRRSTALFSLPSHGPEGTALIWGTADAIWRSLGDTSDDVNYYTKRMTLGGVYAATLLFWLGDDSEDFANTRAFLDRRIADVMRMEKLKSTIKSTPLGKMVMAGAGQILGRIRAPEQAVPTDLPGYTGPQG
ncbi:MAG: COQ9 family protein [Rhodobacteraceae bacterium]|nr:COQ9 family protein [Paracoccaceae bacterium]